MAENVFPVEVSTMTARTETRAEGGIASSSAAFLSWLEDWYKGLTTLDLADFLAEQQASPEQVAVISADLVEGFCYLGPLASPRIADVVGPSAALMQRAYDL